MNRKVRVFLLSKEKYRKMGDFHGMDLDFVAMKPEETKRSDIIRMFFKENNGYHLVGLLDRTGGNNLDDLRSLLEMSLREKDRFACAHVRPKKNGLGCWLVDGDLLKQYRDKDCKNIENAMMNLAREEDLRLFRIISSN